MEGERTLHITKHSCSIFPVLCWGTGSMLCGDLTLSISQGEIGSIFMSQAKVPREIRAQPLVLSKDQNQFHAYFSGSVLIYSKTTQGPWRHTRSCRSQLASGDV